MNHDDDDLARIDLHAWRVPPPPAVDRASILTRALAPAAAPRRSRTMWAFAALALANIVLAAIIVIVLSQRAQQTTVIRAAGGGSVDVQTAKVLAQLAQEQLELEQKLIEIKQLRDTVEQLAQKVHDCDATVKHDHVVVTPVLPVPPVPPGPRPVVPPPPQMTPSPLPDNSCDEVSCVLMNYESGCCDKYKKPSPPPPRPSLPESLDRQAISSGIASVKARVAACGAASSAKGKVKVHVRVGADGLVTSVEVDSTPDAALGGCVAAAVQRAVFPRTQQGGSFSYPFVF